MQRVFVTGGTGFLGKHYHDFAIAPEPFLSEGLGRAFASP